ncbi:C-Myc-binding protein isoform X1 [Passer montanus]|uniref:C-Myc-binding protein isoform X1 n=1 Tax=Passer montanus TaxID=9160 RepID=UPI001961B8C1|nr:C-Myc-binding protein isoform X1 [Passer montanus]
MAHHKAADSKREQFRQYLEKSGVLDMLTKVRRGGRQKNSPGKLGAAWPGNGARGARRGGARRERAAGRWKRAAGAAERSRPARSPRCVQSGQAGPFPCLLCRRPLFFGQSATFNACFCVGSLI